MRMRVEFMRLQKILIIAIFVLILTVGAVSASDNNQTSDSLMVNDDDEIETLDECDSNHGDDVSLNMDNKDEKLTVGTEDPSMNVTVDDILEGEDAVVNAFLESDATGSIIVDINGTAPVEPVFLYDSVSSGSASIPISNLLAGNYTVKTVYSGDDKYASATVYSKLTVKGIMFNHLQTIINDDTTGVITLDRDFYGNSTEIVISKTITINGNGHTLNANGLSRIFHITAGNVVINNLTFVNASTESNGGAVYFDSVSTGIVRNCNFTNNSAEDGGAVYFDDTGNVENCNFVNNNATEYGGGVFCYNEGTITNCSFTNNSAAIGGAIYFGSDESIGNVINCNFISNSANRGGAIRFKDGGSVENCNFIGNAVDEYGSAVYFTGSGNVTDCSFTNNSGCAIYFKDSGSVENCNFTDNSAVEGGAVYFTGSGNVINCTFIANEASGNGGAVYFRSSGIVRGCNFTNNTVTGNLCSGSAIYFNRDGNGWGIVANCNFNHNIKSGYGEPSTVDFVNGNVTDCKFNNNNGGLTWSKTTGNVLNCEFTNNGGIAIYVYSSGSCTVANCSFTNNYRPINIEGSGNVTNCNFTNSSGSVIGMFDGNVINCSFTNNKRAIDLSYGNVTNCSFAYNFENIDNGGAIRMDYGNVTDCSFIGNAAFNNGGAVYFEGSGNVTGCNFIGNLAVESLGGAVYFKNNGNVINCNFTNNSARSAGAVYFEGSGNVTDCNFVNNNATWSAGGVFCSNEVTITNCSFTNNSAEDGGAVYIWGSGNVTNCNFIGCMAGRGGAVFIWYEGTVTNCNFIGNTAGDGGAIYAAESTCSVMSCSFVNSTAGQSGGAVYVDEDGIGYFVDCSFLNSYSQKGGAVCIGDNSPGTTVVNGCSFVNSVASNSAESDSLGGAIHFGTDVTGEVTNCKFTDSSANLDGGAIYFDGKGTVIDCTFINNNGDRGCGGAVYFKGDSVVENCNFVNNSAYAGGAVYFYENGNVTNCNFTDNNVTGDGSTGGAVYVYENGNVTNCNFVNNYADGFGAAVYFEGSGNVTNCNFVDNSAFETGAVFFDENGNVADCNFTNNNVTGFLSWGWGGAIFFNQYSYGIVINCNFVNNTAALEGGAVYFDEYSAGTVTNCNFTNNTAGYGGAVYFDENGNVTNCNFVNNTAGSGGGAVYFDENGNVTNCNFVNNTAGEGGAIVWSGAEGKVIDSVFSDNTAKLFGGAIYWEGGRGNLVSSRFIHNTAGEGGAIYWIEGNGTIADSTFTDNVAGEYGGAVYWMEGNGTIVDSTFIHNTAGEYGGAVYAADSNVEIICSHFENNGAVMGGAIYGCTYDDDCTFEANSKPQIYPYSKVNATMEIAAVYGEDLMITVTLPDDATGDINITVVGMLYSRSITNGLCIINVPDLSSGKYKISATYGGDIIYLPTSSSINVTISKTEPVITVDAGNVEYGETESVKVTLPSDATGSVEFTLRNANSQIINNKNSILSGGTASYTLPENLNVGKYILNTQYFGDSRYEGSLSCSTFYVSPKISITPDVTIGDDGVITMDLGDVTGNIRVYVDWEEDGSKRILDGKFVYNLPTWAMTVGNHTIYFQYSGNSFDENVFNQWNNETGTYEPILYHFFIHKKQSESEAETKGEVLEVILEDANGTVLSNATGNIEFTILNQLTNEVTKVVVAIVNGIASLDISQFNDGNYIISWYYAGDDKHVPMSKTMSLQISRKVSRITAGDLSTVYSSSQAYSVRVYGADGYPVSGVPVTFLINNRAFRTVTTDRNGFASVAITQAPGNYKITAKSQTVSVTKKLAVMHVLSLSKVSVKRTAKKITIKATLKKVNGKYLKGKKITFRFNGKKYTAKTNKKGVAKITVKKNVLKKLRKGKKVTYQATYLKDTVKKSIKVR